MINLERPMKKALLFLLSLLVLTTFACSTSSGSAERPTPRTQGQGETTREVPDKPTLNKPTLNRSTKELPTLPAQANVGMQELQAVFASAKPDENGNISVTITDDQLNKAIQMGQQAGQQLSTPRASGISNVAITFTPEKILFEAELSGSNSGKLVVEFVPSVVNGVLQFEVTSATLGGIKVPKLVLDAAEETLNSTLSEAMSQMPENAALQDVQLGDGTLTVIGKVG
jgi:hypothetical protein